MRSVVLRQGRIVITASLFLLLIFLSLNYAVADTQNLGGSSIVWFANHNAVHAVDAETNEVVHVIPQSQEVSDILVDPKDRSVWVLLHKNVHKYDAYGSLLVDSSLNQLSSQVPNPYFLTLSPHDGSLWITAGKLLLHLNAQGELLHTWENTDKIDSVTVDMAGNLWVLSKDQLIRVSKEGDEFHREDLSGRLKNIQYSTLDPLGEVLWLANQKELLPIQLSSIDPSLPPYLLSDPSGISRIALDSINGTLWITTADHLLAYDRSGKQVAVVPLPTRLKPVEDLAIDSLSHDIWLGTKKAVVRFSPNGAIIAEIPVANELEALAVAPAFPRPQLTLVEPLDQSLINNSSPSIRYQLGGLCGDSLCDPGAAYYQYLNLDITLNGYPIGNQFVIDGYLASFTLPSPVPDGQNQLSATATDVYGNVSEAVISTFYVDTIPPHFLEFTPSNGSVITEEEIIISGRVDDPSAVVALENIIEIGGSIISTNPSQFSFRLPLSLGDNYLTFSATDPAGNQQRETLVLVRTVPLELLAISIEDGIVVSETELTISGTIAGLPGTTVTVNGIPVVVDADGKFTLENVPLNPGQNTLTIVVRSPDGQVITKTLTVFVSSGGRWEEPMLLSDGNHEMYLPETPLISIDKKGNVLVVWEERGSERFALSNIMSRRYIAGSGWGDITTVAEKADPDHMDLAMNEVGDAMLVWGRCLHIYCYTSSGQYHSAIRFDSNTGWDSSPVRIDGSVTNRGFEPRTLIGLDTLGNAKAIILLNNYIVENNFSVGAGWSGTNSLGIYYPGSGVGEFMDLDIGKDGKGILAWRRTNLIARRYDPFTGWSPYDELYQNISYDSAPKVAIDANGDSLITATYDKAVKLYRFNTETGWQTQRLDNQLPVFSRVVSDIDVNSKGDISVAWDFVEYGGNEFIGINDRINNSWLGERIISDHPGQSTNSGSLPDVHLNDNGDAVAVWRQYDGKGPYYFPTYDGWARVKSGGAWGPALPIESNDEYTIGHLVAVIDNNGIATAVWIQGIGSNRYSIFASRYNPGQVGSSAPVVMPPPDIEVEATAVLTPVDIGQATASDAVDGSLVAIPDTVGPFPVGPNFVTWSATNSQGVIRTTVQNVIINDTTAPVLTIPNNIEITVTDTSTLPTVIDLGTATATDIFTPINITNDAPVAFDPGKTVVTWTAVDPNGNKTTAQQTITVKFDGDIFIRISDPVAGQRIDAGEVTVSGVFIGPANAGVTVNGVIAAITNGRFYANNVPMNNGDNVIRAIGTTPSGVTVEDSITVNADGNSYYIVELDPAEGVAPLNTEFTITDQSNAETQKIYVDYDGDGTNDDVKAGGDWVFNHTYTSPGVYMARFTIHNIYGVVREKTAVVVVHDAAEMDDMFKVIWADMNAALKAGDITAASTYFNKSAKDRYVPVFSILLPDMANIIESYSELRRISVSDGLGEYAVMRVQHGEKRLYLIYFLRGFDGVWRIDSM